MFMLACSLAFMLACTFALAGLVAGLGDDVTVVLVLVFSDVAQVEAETTNAINAR